MKNLKIILLSTKKFLKNVAVNAYVIFLGLKNCLLEYSNDDDNSFEGNYEKLGWLAREIHDFSSRYRRKVKKTRRGSMQTQDLMKIPKF